MRKPGADFPLAGGVDLSALVQRAQRPAPSTSAPQNSGFVRDISEAEMGAIVELSQTIPVILEVYGQGVAPQLAPIVNRYQGRIVLATIDASRAPQLVSALQISGIPTVFAVIQGRPAPLFQGMAPEDQITAVFDEVLKVAAEAGVTGVMPAPETDGESTEQDSEPSLSAHVLRAQQAIGNNDYDGADQAFQAALAENPRDPDALAGRARLRVLRRLEGLQADAIRQSAAAEPGNVAAQLLVADLDIAGGHIDDAFGRLLGIFAELDSDARDTVRARLVELFDAVGAAHPAVVDARRRLTSMLY